MALGSTQLLTEISSLPGIFLGGKGDRCVGLTTLPHLCAACLEIWEPQPVVYPGILFGGWGGCSINSVEDRGQRERGSGGGSPLVRGSGGSYNLVKETSLLIVKVS